DGQREGDDFYQQAKRGIDKTNHCCSNQGCQKAAHFETRHKVGNYHQRCGAEQPSDKKVHGFKSSVGSGRPHYRRKQTRATARTAGCARSYLTAASAGAAAEFFLASRMADSMVCSQSKWGMGDAFAAS